MVISYIMFNSNKKVYSIVNYIVSAEKGQTDFLTNGTQPNFITTCPCSYSAMLHIKLFTVVN